MHFIVSNYSLFNVDKMNLMRLDHMAVSRMANSASISLSKYIMKFFGFSLLFSIEVTQAVGIKKSNCGKVLIDEYLKRYLQRCDVYDISHSDCVKWIEQELRTTCRGEYNCIETSPGDLSIRESYSGMSDT